MACHAGGGAAHGMSQTMAHAGPIDCVAPDGLRRALSAPPRGAKDLGTKKEAPLGDDTLSQFQTTQHRVVVADWRAEPNLPLVELAVLALGRDADVLPT